MSRCYAKCHCSSFASRKLTHVFVENNSTYLTSVWILDMPLSIGSADKALIFIYSFHLGRGWHIHVLHCSSHNLIFIAVDAEPFAFSLGEHGKWYRFDIINELLRVMLWRNAITRHNEICPSCLGVDTTGRVRVGLKCQCFGSGKKTENK